MAQFAGPDAWVPDESWKDAFEGAPVALCVVDTRSLAFRATNRLFREMLLRTASELLDMSWRDVAAGDDSDLLTRAADTVLWKSDGTTCTVRIGAVQAMEGSGTALITAIDVTETASREQRSIELLADAERAGSRGEEFLSGMSHELRTPLNAIIGLSEILAQGAFGELADKQLEMIGEIESAGRDLLRLIEDILHFARMSSPRSELTLEDTSLKQLAHESLNQRREAAADAEVSLETRAVPDIQFRGDRQSLRQVIVHLLDNAIRHTGPTGSVWIEAAVADDQVAISVGDTGEGIRSGMVGELFSPFPRIDESAEAKLRSGLGLSFASKVAKLHGGSMSVESKWGYGSKFTISVPLIGPEEPGADNTVETVVKLSRPIRVLVAEDHDPSREMLVNYLHQLGMDVEEATTGFEAVVAARDKQPDLILMDVQMPEMDGLEATRLIKAMPDLGAIPVVALTGRAVDGDAERILEAGCDSYLAKPVALNGLMDTVREFCAA